MKHTTLPPRRKPLKSAGKLRPVSRKQAKAKSQQQQAYKEVKARVQWCESCGRRDMLSPSHALTQGRHKEQAANPANIFLLCFYCHYIWEHNKPRFAELAPDVWARKLAIIKELSPEQYQLLHINYPDLVPES